MRKVLIHAGISPLDRPDMDAVFREQLFSSNSGNLLFQYSAFRAMMTEGTQADARFLDRGNLTDEEIERINAEYACVVLPMANNFRRDFHFQPLTAFVRRLRIPCVVMGIGLQAFEAAQIRDGFPFDDSVRDFVSAILDHSALLGLRGEVTAEYLQHLGFAPERHFTVTGCPSMYAAGLKLPEVRHLPLDSDSPVCINYRKEQPAPLFEVMNRAMVDFPAYRLVFQRIEEMFLLRYGYPIHYDYRRGKDDTGLYLRKRSDPPVRNGHAIGFANAAVWLDFMKGMRFSFGCRIHGNIAAVLAGTPALVFSIDTRTDEICHYHCIPSIHHSQMTPDTDLRDLYERTDFSSVHRGHEERFRHFVDFLNANGLDHIYRETLTPTDPPLDKAVAGLPAWGILENPRHISPPPPHDGRGHPLADHQAEAAPESCADPAQRACRKGQLTHASFDTPSAKPTQKGV